MAYEIPQRGKRFEPDHHFIYDEYDYGHVLDMISQGIKRVKLSEKGIEDFDKVFYGRYNDSMDVNTERLLTLDHSNYPQLGVVDSTVYDGDDEDEDLDLEELRKTIPQVLEVHPLVMERLKKEHSIKNQFTDKKYNDDCKSLAVYRPNNIIEQLAQRSYVEEILDEDDNNKMDIE